MIRLLSLLLCMFCVCAVLRPAMADGRAASLGLSLTALDAADLDAIQQQFGKRAGVQVADVLANSLAAKGGFVPGEVILTIAGQIVDSPQAVEKVLTGKTGSVEFNGFFITDTEAKVTKHTLLLPGAAKPATKPDTTPAKTTPAGTPERKYDTSRKGKTYEHAIGFSFWYPEGWVVKDVNDALQLVPHNAAVANGQPAEVYFITGQPLEGSGVTSANDPQVIAFLDQLIHQKVSAAMQRTKEPTAITTTNGKGLVMEWEVKGEHGTVLARTYTCILKGWGVIFGAFGIKDKVLAREADLKTIFNSFGFEAGKQDPAVVGAWQLFATRTLRNEDNINFTTDDPRRASSVSSEQTTLLLRPDGTAQRVSIYRMIAGGGAAGGSSKVWIDTGEQKDKKTGRWNAGNGTLFVMWSNGAMDSWRYGLVRNGATSLKLQVGNTVQFWSRR